jgi:hypothetical protein
VQRKADWREEFIEFAFTGREKKTFIERNARKPNRSFKEDYKLVRNLRESRRLENDVLGC